LIQIQSSVSIENMEPGICIVFLTFLFSTVVADDAVSADLTMDAPEGRDPKLSIFQVVKFTNSHCTGSTKNGTCYTSQECENIGGVQDGTCADGFGVCCTVTLTTGGSTSVNNSYIQVSSTTNLDLGTNLYTICPCSDDICRIKFDFESFDIQGPNSGFVYIGAAASIAETYNFANTVGQCMIDTFQIYSPSGRSSPLICGDNDNQHMIMDVSDNECLTVDLGIGTTTTSTTRELDIRIMQYRCGEEAGGPPGCLQYFENTSGKIRSFNFPDASPGTAITAGYATHLPNQHYSVCMRQGAGKEVICYIPCTSTVGTGTATSTTANPTAQPSFGLSINNEDANAEGAQDSECSTDYIWIPNGIKYNQFTTAISIQDKPLEGNTNALQANRYCGRYFQTVSTAMYASIEPSSICSYVTPFVLGVNFDNQEFCEESGDGMASTTPDRCEGVAGTITNMNGGAGQLGFSLCYVQHTPPI